jgi:hypothetical protein
MLCVADLPPRPGNPSGDSIPNGTWIIKPLGFAHDIFFIVDHRTCPPVFSKPCLSINSIGSMRWTCKNSLHIVLGHSFLDSIEIRFRNAWPFRGHPQPEDNNESDNDKHRGRNASVPPSHEGNYTLLVERSVRPRFAAVTNVPAHWP